MKILIEFSDNDINDYNLFNKRKEMYFCIESIREYIRSKIKYSEISEETETILEEIRELLTSSLD